MRQGMSSGLGESTTTTTRKPQGSNCSSSSTANEEAGNFECNICLDLAQDPIVTLCGHLFCWPCLYKWLGIHSHSHECPVCKAVIQQEKLVPLYGRGKKTFTDPCSRSIPGVDIPHRPTGQRPETAPTQNPNQFPQPGFGFMGGFPPMATARWGNFAFSAGFGGLFPSLFNFHLHGIPDATAAAYGPAPAPGFPYGFTNAAAFHGGGGAHGFPTRTGVRGQQADSHLTTLFLIVGALVLSALVWL